MYRWASNPLSMQARSQVVLRGGAIQRGDGPNEVGRELWLSETENCSKFATGGAHFERVSVSQLGGSGGILLRKIFKFKHSEMAGNAFKTNMVW